MNYFLKFFATMIVFFIGGLVSIHAQEKSIDIDAKHEIELEDNKKEKLLNDYSWLENLIDKKDCQGLQISVYKMKKANAKFVFIEDGKKRVMYNESGEVYCTNSDELDCLQFYDLAPSGDTWICAVEWIS